MLKLGQPADGFAFDEDQWGRLDPLVRLEGFDLFPRSEDPVIKIVSRSLQRLLGRDAVGQVCSGRTMR